MIASARGIQGGNGARATTATRAAKGSRKNCERSVPAPPRRSSRGSESDAKAMKAAARHARVQRQGRDARHSRTARHDQPPGEGERGGAEDAVEREQAAELPVLRRCGGRSGVRAEVEREAKRRRDRGRASGHELGPAHEGERRPPSATSPTSAERGDGRGLEPPSPESDQSTRLAPRRGGESREEHAPCPRQQHERGAECPEDGRKVGQVSA